MAVRERFAELRFVSNDTTGVLVLVRRLLEVHLLDSSTAVPLACSHFRIESRSGMLRSGCRNRFPIPAYRRIGPCVIAGCLAEFGP